MVEEHQTTKRASRRRKRPPTLQQHSTLVGLLRGDRRIQRLMGRGAKPA